MNKETFFWFMLIEMSIQIISRTYSTLNAWNLPDFFSVYTNV